MVKRNMLYFSEIQYKFIVDKRSDFELKDGVLVCCQQTIELLLKHLLQERNGTYDKIHGLVRLMGDLDRSLVKPNRELLTILTDCYYDCRYSSDDYYDYNEQEFKELVDKTLKLREQLLEIDKLQKSKSFS